MRFCQAFMTSLFRYIGPDTDVPAGDIGVGGREIGFLFGQYRRLANEFTGALTGKGLDWGGSHLRPEATGYGCVYFVEEMLKTRDEGLLGKRVSISGSRNVAQYAAQKCMELGAKVVTLSDSDGFIVDEEGLDEKKWHYVMDLKNVRRGRLREYVGKFRRAKYVEGRGVWKVPCDVALPCATQNELDGDDAKALAKNRCMCVAEGPTCPPPRGGRGLPRCQDSFRPRQGGERGRGRRLRPRDGAEQQPSRVAARGGRLKLRTIMQSIHSSCVGTAIEFDAPENYVIGANIAGFRKVADAMLDQGSSSALRRFDRDLEAGRRADVGRGDRAGRLDPEADCVEVLSDQRRKVGNRRVREGEVIRIADEVERIDLRRRVVIDVEERPHLEWIGAGVVRRVRHDANASLVGRRVQCR